MIVTVDRVQYRPVYLGDPEDQRLIVEWTCNCGALNEDTLRPGAWVGCYACGQDEWRVEEPVAITLWRLNHTAFTPVDTSIPPE